MKLSSKSKKKEIVKKILEGDETAIVTLYNQYRRDFVKWARYQYRMDEDSALDIFQDVIVSFYDNIKQGRLTRIQNTVKTYLYAIAKNLISNKMRHDGKVHMLEEDMRSHANDALFKATMTFNEEAILSDREETLIRLLRHLGEPCHSILKLFYFDSFSMESIANRLGYKNEHVAKAQKRRCIKELKSQAEQFLKKEDFF